MSESGEGSISKREKNKLAQTKHRELLQMSKNKMEQSSADGPRLCDVYPSRIRPLVANRTAILIVDVQNLVTDEGRYPLSPEFYKEAKENVIPNIRKLIDTARNYNVEVVYTVIENFTQNGRDRSLDHKLSNIFVAKGSREAKVVDEIAPQGDEMVIPKTSSSLFNSTNFEYLMRNIGIDTIAVTGFLTDQCIDQTVRDAAGVGFWTICVDDACATVTKERHCAALSAFKGYCRMESTDTLIEAMHKDFGPGQKQNEQL